MWHDGSQNNEISCSFRAFSRNLAEDQNQTELLNRYSLTRASENYSKSWFVVFTNLHLLSYIGLAHLLFASFPTSFEKARKCTLHPHTI